MKVRVVIFVRFLHAQHALPSETGILVISSPFDSLRSLRVNSVQFENGAAWGSRDIDARPKAERMGDERIKSLDLSVAQHIATKILPSWIQSVNQGNFLRS
jgi:hypothetical protein